MTQTNIDTMDIIVNKMATGMKLSAALSQVYYKRNVRIPFNEEQFNISVMALGMSPRATNALMRAKLTTLNDVVKFCQGHKITDVANLGRTSGLEIFEAILDYCWNGMSDREKTSFLIDTVERNEGHVRIAII